MELIMVLGTEMREGLLSGSVLCDFWIACLLLHCLLLLYEWP